MLRFLACMSRASLRYLSDSGLYFYVQDSGDNVLNENPIHEIRANHERRIENNVKLKITKEEYVRKV